MTTTATAEIPAEWVALGEQINAATEERRARIAAENYRRQVTLRRGFESILITVAPTDFGDTYEINGTSFEAAGRGNQRVGGAASRYRSDLAEAKAYANGWVSDLVAKGYEIVRKA